MALVGDVRLCGGEAPKFHRIGLRLAIRERITSKPVSLPQIDVVNRPCRNLTEPDIMLRAAFACHIGPKPASERLHPDESALRMRSNAGCTAISNGKSAVNVRGSTRLTCRARSQRQNAGGKGSQARSMLRDFVSKFSGDASPDFANYPPFCGL